MTDKPLLAKLQYKSQDPVLILNAPTAFRPVITAWKKLARIDTASDPNMKYAFAIGFVQSVSEIVQYGVPIARQMEEDGLFWMAYPKKTSKKYSSSITRDAGWEPLGELGFEVVRMIAIDEDWSAMRFRKAAYIGTMIRRQGMAMSAEGKKKSVNKTNKAIRGGQS
jgi:hypothetical protein